MKLPGFVPEDLRQLLRFVPLRGWDAVEWTPLLGSLRRISWQFATGSGVKKLGRKLGDLAPMVDIERANRDVEPLADVPQAARRRSAGDDLLRFYFAQWHSEDGLFLDLRPGRVGVTGSRLRFNPNGLWIRLRPEFREGMLGLYRSFYSDDEGALDASLRQMGLLADHLDDEAETDLKELLQAHFGVQQREQHFSIDTFKASFDQLFEFFVEHDYRMHSDFVFVGFYLITLYLTLEAGGQAHDVRSICEETLG